MYGLDYLGTTEIGVEGTDIAKMFGGLLSGTGGILSGKKPAQGSDAAAAEALKQAEAAKKQAEASAARTKKIAIGVGGAAIVAAGFWWLKK